MTQGHDPVIDNNGLPEHRPSASAVESVAVVTSGPSEVEMSATTAGPVARTGPARRSRMGMRPSTMMLIAVWIAVLALYLAVRPGG